MYTHACFTLRTRINMYTCAAAAAAYNRRRTLVIAESRRRAPSFPPRLRSPTRARPRCRALVHLQTFAYKYTGYLDGWYAD